MAMITGRRVDFPVATTPFSINCCYQKHLATLRFDKVYMYARDNNCRMTSKKGEEGSLHEITVAGKADSESVCSSRVHRSGKVT